MFQFECHLAKLPLEVLNECLGYCSTLSLLRLASTNHNWRWTVCQDMRATMMHSLCPKTMVVTRTDYWHGCIGMLFVSESGDGDDVTHPAFLRPIERRRLVPLIPHNGSIVCGTEEIVLDRFKWSPLRRAQFAIWTHMRRAARSASIGRNIIFPSAKLDPDAVEAAATRMLQRIETLAWLELYRNALQSLMEAEEEHEAAAPSPSSARRQEVLVFVKEWARLRALETARMFNLASQVAEELDVPAALLRSKTTLRSVDFPVDPKTGDFVSMTAIRSSLRFRSLDACEHLEIDITDDVEPFENIITCHLKSTTRDIVESNAVTSRASAAQRKLSHFSYPGMRSFTPPPKPGKVDPKMERFYRQLGNTNAVSVTGKPGTLHRGGQSGAKEEAETWDQRIRRLRSLRLGN